MGALLPALALGCGAGPSADAGIPDAQRDADPIPVCASAPGGPTRFVDVTTEAGIAFAPAHHPKRLVSAGVAVVDVDGDGDLDVLVAGDEAGVGVFLNRGDATFDDRSAPGLVGAIGFAAADVDRDGVTDVVLLRAGREGWLRLGPDGTATVAELDPAVPPIYAAAGDFGDADGDGDVDLYVGAYLDVDAAVALTGQPNRLWLNPGAAGAWAEVAAARGADLGAAPTLAVAWLDLGDDPGPSELLAAQDYGMLTRPNALLVPEPGAGYADAAAALGLEHELLSMGIAVADFDGDGAFDLYISNAGANVLAMRRGDTFVDEARARGAAVSAACDDTRPFGGWPTFDPASPDPIEAALATWLPVYADLDGDRPVATSWDAEPFDVDHDGDEDLVVVNGAVALEPYIPESLAQRSVLLLNQGDGTFADASPQSGLDEPGDGRGAAAGDLDGDGDLDLVVARMDVFGVGGVRVYRNDAVAGGSLIVTLAGGPASPPDGIGAIVEVRVGARWQRRRVATGGGFASARAPFAHFGLAGAAAADELIVRWPSGTVDRQVEVPAGAVTVAEGSAP